MNLEILELIFWAALGAIGYIYVGYPLLLAVLARPRTAHPIRDVEDLAHVTMLISAHNESDIIREKIHNTLALDYPRGFLRIIVVSDCSSDGTDEIVLRHAAQ